MNKGYKMTPQEKQSRFRQTLQNQAEKLFNQQTSQTHPQNSLVDFTTNTTNI